MVLDKALLFDEEVIGAGQSASGAHTNVLKHPAEYHDSLLQWAMQGYDH